MFLCKNIFIKNKIKIHMKENVEFLSYGFLKLLFLVAVFSRGWGNRSLPYLPPAGSQ